MTHSLALLHALVQVEDGEMVLNPGITSCHKLRTALRCDKSMPLVVYTSLKSLPTHLAEQILAFFESTPCALLAPHRDVLLAALPAPEAAADPASR